MVTGCLRLSDISVIHDVVNQHRMSQKTWAGFLLEVYRPGEWLWIDSKVKMETRNPIQSYFGNELPAICNYCGFMAAWSRKTLKFKKRNFGVFLEKWPPTVTVKFSNSFPKVFIMTPIDVLCSNFVKFGQRKIENKFCLALQLSLQCGLRPKSARVSPQQCTQSAPGFIQIGSLSTEL